MAGLLGAFMAVLNIQITNASLLDIEGGIGTGVDNGAWISTAYLIGEIIVIPLTDYLSRVFSFRRFLLTNAVLFLIFSVACAFAAYLQQMIALRAIQGFTGGVLIPMAFTLILTKLPARAAAGRHGAVRHHRDLRARHRSDHRRLPDRELRLAIHLLHQPRARRDHGGHAVRDAGAAADATRSAETRRLVRHRLRWRSASARCKPCWRRATRTTGSARPFIVRLAAIAVVFLTLFVWIELTVKYPAVNLRLLTRRNFGLGTLRQHAGRLRALRLGVSAAAISRPDAGLQFRADRRGDGLDRPAAAC